MIIYYCIIKTFWINDYLIEPNFDRDIYLFFEWGYKSITTKNPIFGTKFMLFIFVVGKVHISFLIALSFDKLYDYK